MSLWGHALEGRRSFADELSGEGHGPFFPWPSRRQTVDEAKTGSLSVANNLVFALNPGTAGSGASPAAARQLGLNTVQYGQQRRAEAMGDIGQAASIAGQGGQIQGLGGSRIAGGANTLGLAASDGCGGLIFRDQLMGVRLP